MDLWRLAPLPSCRQRPVEQVRGGARDLLQGWENRSTSIVSDLLGISARRMRQDLADGETDPTALARLAVRRLPATPAQLCDAF